MGNAGAAKLQTHLGNLRSFTGASSSSDNHNLVIANCLKYFLPTLTYRQIGRIANLSYLHWCAT
jgi:hypothetical protein